MNQVAAGCDPEEGRAELITSSNRSPGRDSHWVVEMGFLLFVTSVTQFILGSTLKSKGIQVLEVNFMESYYPPAGNPMAGFLAYGVGASFFIIALFAKHGRPVRFITHAIWVWSALALVVIIYGTFDQLTVYNYMKDFITCTQHFDDDDRFAGDCICTSSSALGGSIEVNKARFEDFRCVDITGTTGRVLASYILTWFVVAFLVVNIVLHSRLWLTCPCLSSSGR